MTEVGSRDINGNTDSEWTLCPENRVHICLCENRKTKLLYVHVICGNLQYNCVYNNSKYSAK